MMSLQHRGHDAAGVAGFIDEESHCIETLKGLGKVNSVITHQGLDKFAGTTFIAHTRYSTRNAVTSVREIHPHWAQSMRGRLAIVTNGDLLHIEELYQEILDSSIKVYTKNDAEIIANLINIHIRSKGKHVVQAIKETMEQIKGGYAALMMMEDDDRIFAFRDPWGIRPLHLAEFIIDGHKSVAIASETCVFDIIHRYNLAEYPEESISFTQREVLPGEIIVLDSWANIESFLLREVQEQKIGCVFEGIYFSRPDSIQRGESFQILRERMGAQLFKESPIDADLVTAVPKGGIPAAMGYANAAGLPYSAAILEEPTTGGLRSFTTHETARKTLATMKYNILPDIIKDKRIVVIDDSIVRGTTSILLVKNLFNAGAKEVHLRIPCPPYNHPCNYGIETKDPTTLISHNSDTETIRKKLGSTSLAYLSLSGLYEAIGKPEKLFCDECLTNRNPITPLD